MLSQFNACLPEIFRAIDLTGVLLNGVLGGRLARIKRFDAVGFCVLSLIHISEPTRLSLVSRMPSSA